MIATQTRTMWADVLLCWERGQPVSGADLRRLPGFDWSDVVSPFTEYAISERGPTMAIITNAAKLAGLYADALTQAELIADAVHFHMTIAEGKRRDREAFRALAWEIGAAADFVAGLKEVAG